MVKIRKYLRNIKEYLEDMWYDQDESSQNVIILSLLIPSLLFGSFYIGLIRPNLPTPPRKNLENQISSVLDKDKDGITTKKEYKPLFRSYHKMNSKFRYDELHDNPEKKLSEMPSNFLEKFIESNKKD